MTDPDPDERFAPFDWEDPGAPRGALVFGVDPDGRVLMQLRDDRRDVTFGGLWSPFGGGVDDGETLRQAAVRELIEETGVGLPAEKLTPFARAVSNTPGRTRLYHFIARLPLPPESIRVQEGAGFGFLTPRQLREFPMAWPVRDIVVALADRIEAGEAP